MTQITNRDISIGVKVGYFLITAAISVCVAMASISFTSGQYINTLKTHSQEIDTLKREMRDTAKIVTDVAVMKNDIQYIKQYIQEIRKPQ